MTRDSTRKRNEKLRAYYLQLREAKTERGNEMYTRMYCVEKTAERFFLSPERVSVIVYSKDTVS